jgi:histidine ammonia-lyase
MMYSAETASCSTLDRRARAGIFAPVLAVVATLALAGTANAQFNRINPTKADQTIVLDGHSLTIEQLVDIARGGARIEIAPDALERAAASYGLMLQAQAEGVSVYRFNRGAGQQREIVTLTGDPMSPEAQKIIQGRFTGGGGPGGLEPDILREDVLRAMLAVNANIVTYEAASPEFIRGLVDMLNHGIYPAVPTRGGRGESDFVPAVATMSGRGYAYYQGERMPADEAFRRAGVKLAKLSGNDDALNTTSALTTGMAALLVQDVHAYLEWADLTYAMVLDGMNSSLTPMSMPVRDTRPFPWSSYSSERIFDMLRGSYLFDYDPDRIIQDPESMRATPWRLGAAWEAWASLRDTALIQMNSTDHNPTARPGVSPEDSWELSTPHFMQYYIEGGKYSNGVGGYIFSNSNWHPYPLMNKIEAFSMALMNLSVIQLQTVNRFANPFFTVVTAEEVLNPDGENRIPRGARGGDSIHWLWAEIQSYAMPLTPDAISGGEGVADISSVPLLRLSRANAALDAARELLATEMIVAGFWMDVRKVQNPDRSFGKAPTAVWEALRKMVPMDGEPAQPATVSSTTQVAAFMQATPASTFFTGGPAMPDPGTIPMAVPSRAGRQ